MKKLVVEEQPVFLIEELSGIDGLFEMARMSSFKHKIKAKGYQVM